MKYNKLSYWSKRKDPNSNESKATRNLQIEWTKKYLKEGDNILDYGPGILRLVELYKGDYNINFYDITDNYKSTVESKCNENGIEIKKYIIDSIGIIKTPFNDDEFDVVLCSEVFLHSPDNEIVDLICELGRIGKKVVVTTWYENGKYVYNNNHCWTRDYKKILEDNGLNIIHWEEDLFNNKQVGFVYNN